MATSTFVCRKCKETINESDRDNHEQLCLYSLQIKPTDDVNIPCDSCGKFISFDEYAAHMNICGMGSLISDIRSNMASFGMPRHINIRPVSHTESYAPIVEDTHLDEDEDDEDLLDIMDDNINKTINGINKLLNKMQSNNEIINNVKQDIKSFEIDVPDTPIPVTPEPVTTEDNDEFPELPEPVNLQHQIKINNLKRKLPSDIRSKIYNKPNSQYHLASPKHYPIRYSNNTSYGNPASYSNPISYGNLNSIPDEFKHLLNIAQQTLTRRMPHSYYSPTSNDESYEDLMSLRDKYGVVEIGVSNIDLVAPIHTLKDGEKAECVIGTCPDKPKKYRKVICDHEVLFCDDCLSTWLSKNKTCPICMKDLDEMYNQKFGKLSPTIDSAHQIFDVSMEEINNMLKS